MKRTKTKPATRQPRRPRLFSRMISCCRTTWRASLYHDHAKHEPIFDYHCHLPPDQIAANKMFRNLYEVWLAGDHYKWRAMRSNGVSEKYCTGDASDWEKFLAFARTVPHTLRNPLYHWTHLELKMYFGITDLLDESTAERDLGEGQRQAAFDARCTRTSPSQSRRGRLHDRRPDRLAGASPQDPRGGQAGHARVSDLSSRQGADGGPASRIQRLGGQARRRSAAWNAAV